MPIPWTVQWTSHMVPLTYSVGSIGTDPWTSHVESWHRSILRLVRLISWLVCLIAWLVCLIAWSSAFAPIREIVGVED